MALRCVTSIPMAPLRTTTRKVQLERLPAASEAVSPARKSGTAPWQPAPAEATTAAGQTIDGGVVSRTVKFVVQVLEFPAASVTTIVIVCVPRPTRLPAAGLWLFTSEPAGVQ